MGGRVMINRIPLVLKYDAWPSADKSMWDALFSTGDIFDGTGPCEHWSEGSRQKRRQGYGQWLSFLQRTNPDALVRSPVERITQSAVRAYIEECVARLKPRSTSGLISDLYVIATHISQDTDWTWLATASQRLLQRANTRSLPAAHQITAGEIFEWSVGRMADLQAQEDILDLRKAIWFRQALMIGFLISRPLRRRSLLAMDTDRHLTKTPDGFHVSLRACDMKDGKARSFPLPSLLVDPMSQYLKQHRVILLQGKRSSALWISQYGEPMTPDGLSRELPKVTERYLGLALRPHSFRHIAATSIAELDPEHVNIIRDILGHATLDMSEKHYNRASGISSCNALQSIVEDIRKNVPKMGRA